jgi:hypothetical protein
MRWVSRLNRNKKPPAKGPQAPLLEQYRRINTILRGLVIPPNSASSMQALQLVVRLVVNEAVAGPRDDYGDPRRDLSDVLFEDIGPQQQAWQRLRICGCGALFVALTPRAQYCTPECSNRLRQKAFYEAHTAEERERKLREYEANKERNRRARVRRLGRRTSSG